MSFFKGRAPSGFRGNQRGGRSADPRPYEVQWESGLKLRYATRQEAMDAGMANKSSNGAFRIIERRW